MKTQSSKIEDSVASLKAIKWMFTYCRRYKKMFILDMLLAAMCTLCTLILPKLVRYIIDENLIKNYFNIVILCLVAVFLEIIAESLFSYFGSIVGHKLGYSIETDLRVSLFSYIQKLSFSYFDNHKIGQLVSRITSDLKDIADAVHHCSIEFLIFILQFLGIFCILLHENIKFTLIFFVALPFLIKFVIYFNKKVYIAIKKVKHQLGQINAQTEDSLLGIKTTQAFVNEDLELKKFQKTNKDYFNMNMDFINSVAKFLGETSFIYGMIYLLITILGVYFIKKGQVNTVDFVMYFMYMDIIIMNMRTLTEKLERLQKCTTSIARVREIIDIPPEITNAKEAKFLQNVKGKIEFKKVKFFYDNPKDLILDEVSFTIEAGEKVAIVGVSGAGKSTMCNLIPRFYDVKEGQILIDGTDIRLTTVDSLRKQIGFVSQNIYLFADSIANNIAYGKPDASMEEIKQVAKLANADKFINQMKSSYETYVGERGELLSGGQKQRIGIARAFLKNAPILILDEATSALDSENEAEIYNALSRLCEGRTTIIIAHRLTTIKNADKIFVLCDKKIVESGSHKELMEAKGVYYKLYTTKNI